MLNFIRQLFRCYYPESGLHFIAVTGILIGIVIGSLCGYILQTEIKP